MDLKNNWKVTLGILTLSSVLMSSGYTMLIPFLPMYLIQDLGVDVAEVNWWSGLIFSITFLISGLMAPIWGAMADRKSRNSWPCERPCVWPSRTFSERLFRRPCNFSACGLFRGFLPDCGRLP